MTLFIAPAAFFTSCTHDVMMPTEADAESGNDEYEVKLMKLKSLVK